MPSDEFDRWMKMAEWRGKMVRAVEDVDRELLEIKNEIKDIKIHNTKRDMRTAEISGGVAVLIMLAGFLIQHGLG